MISVSGIGPGSIIYITEEVKNRIQTAEKVIAFKRVAEDIYKIRKDVISIKSVGEIFEHLNTDIAILASGDSLFFGITDYLIREGIKIDQVHPGPTSFQYLMAKVKISWSGANIFSMHGRDADLSSVKNYEKSIILTDNLNTPSMISKKLKDLGIKGRLIAGYDLSYDTEKILDIKIGDEFTDISNLSVVVVINEMV